MIKLSIFYKRCIEFLILERVFDRAVGMILILILILIFVGIGIINLILKFLKWGEIND